MEGFVTTLLWGAFIFVGAYLSAAITFGIGSLRMGGIENFLDLLICATAAALFWIIFAVWISPFSISIN